MSLCNVLLAYLDPATGALVLQAIIACLLAGGVVFRRLLIQPLASLLRLFGKGRQDEATSDSSTTPESE